MYQHCCCCPPVLARAVAVVVAVAAGKRKKGKRWRWQWWAGMLRHPHDEQRASLIRASLALRARGRVAQHIADTDLYH